MYLAPTGLLLLWSPRTPGVARGYNISPFQGFAFTAFESAIRNA